VSFVIAPGLQAALVLGDVDPSDVEESGESLPPCTTAGILGSCALCGFEVEDLLDLAAAEVQLSGFRALAVTCGV
jgi:hypothetical protein